MIVAQQIPIRALRPPREAAQPTSSLAAPRALQTDGAGIRFGGGPHA
jgi:hypothetical protein